MREGEMRMSRRDRGWERVGREREPTPVMGRLEPLPTTMEVGEDGLGRKKDIPEPEPMCAEAPLSKIHSPLGADGGCRAI